MPPGQLEDNEEWQYWFAVNAYSYRGLRAAGEAIGELDPLEGKRLASEAERYRQDIREAALHSMAASPVAPLRDGTWIPTLSTRARLHGRDYGWIRNILYGPQVLVDCGVFSPDEQITGWILRDLEDNLFMSAESFSVPEQDWFSRGGITLQPNLVNTFVTYLKRDDVPLALRAFYNAFAVSYYPDVNAFTEWAPSFGKSGGPFFKTSDEAAFLTWLRLMLVREEGDKLYLASGAPRRWFRPGDRIEGRGLRNFVWSSQFSSGTAPGPALRGRDGRDPVRIPRQRDRPSNTTSRRSGDRARRGGRPRLGPLRFAERICLTSSGRRDSKNPDLLPLSESRRICYSRHSWAICAGRVPQSSANRDSGPTYPGKLCRKPVPGPSSWLAQTAPYAPRCPKLANTRVAGVRR